ncbi:NAD-dependent epimerase/dehydratase family protein [Mycobacterium botniense]|uniref:NAD-dependent epimerase/dehydratase domain-containing protein n=1 Tax=Mycobacterium botniense TaxID=84962 RepID=A0A7I9Y1J7_9MYCO|nr:NAD-dependent epimerase/dehydratase family protein [Mycobacterium botniense]GFG75948.1 hypothetical protein MBOT_33130 [Mycobacterium botniense]
MRILITGVTGVVGRSVARQLVAAGHMVSGIAPYGHRCLDPDVNFVCTSLRDPVLQHLADEADVVIHLAPIDNDAPGSAGINGVVHVTHAAARAGARLLFLSHAAGHPSLYRHAEMLVSTGWAPSLIVRAAPLMGRQLDWMVCRTVATLLRARVSPQPVRLLHVDDLVRFLVLAVNTNRTGAVDVAPPDATNTFTAWRLLRSVNPRPRLQGIRSWTGLTPDMDLAAVQERWVFDFGWTASQAVADTARGLAGRRLSAAGAVSVRGHVSLPAEVTPRLAPSDGMPLHCAAPDGLEGEFDDRIDPRFPTFSCTGLNRALPEPLTPMTLDVQVSGLRAAARVMGQVMALDTVVANEWGSRALAVFGHRLYAGVSVNMVAASQLPGWDLHAIAQQACNGQPQTPVVPWDCSPRAGRLRGPLAKPRIVARALMVLRHLKADTRAYSTAAIAEHLDPAQLAALTDAGLQTRIRMLRDRIHQGWIMTALWVIDSGVTAAALRHSRTGQINSVPGISAIVESSRVDAEIAPLAEILRADPRLAAMARAGDLGSIRARSPAAAAAVDATLTRVGHRGPGEVELANPTFGDDPLMLLAAAAHSAAALPPLGAPERSTLPGRLATNCVASRELARDATMRFTNELRTALRELGSRHACADVIDTLDDVYYLTCEELLAMPADARLRVKRRRAERERLQALRLPGVINRGWVPVSRCPAAG